MRIAIGGLEHETNTFTEHHTSLADFMLAEGADMLSIPDSVRNTALQGIIEVCQAHENLELIPCFYGQALPSGRIEQEAYEWMKTRMIDALRKVGPIDAVVLSMHGSMYVEGIGDGDGDLLAAIRDVVPRGIPIVCALDLHATITDQMIDSANAFVGYRTAPHIDKVETGHKAASLAIEAVTNSLELTTDWVGVPVIISGEQSETHVAPTSDLIAELVHMPGHGDVLSSSIFLGFLWADVSYSCVSGLAVSTRQIADAGKNEAQRLAQMIWDKRNDFQFTTEAYDFATCLDIAEAAPKGPVIIADCGDNPTAGSAENVTLVLETLVARQFQHALVAVIADQEAYKKCLNAGVGNIVDLKLGLVNPGEPVPRPLEIRAKVKTIGESKGVHSVVITIGEVDAIISSQRTEVTDPQFLVDLGLEPQSYQAIVIKSGYLSPQYRALAQRQLLALTPGDTDPILENVPYEKVKRPIFPLDKDFYWEVTE